MNNFKAILLSPKTHRALYVLLLITTPFLMLQNYLQSAIGELSDITYFVGGIEIPLTVTVAVVFLVPIFVFQWKKFTLNRIIGWIIIISLFGIGQKTTDYYFNHKYYELQFNWHYFAYSIFAFINYRALKQNNASNAKIVKHTFIVALLASTFDEAIQIPLSNRIFDIGDISKDLWGAMIGIFFVFFILKNGNILTKEWKIREKKLKNYLNNPFSLLVLGFILAYLFMFTASVLTDTKFAFSAVIISIILFVLIFLIIHFSQFKAPRLVIISAASILTVLLIISIVNNRDKQIKFINNHTILFKGIPLYYFDIMIYPNGTFRLVDKKEIFNIRDQQTIFSHTDNILIIGSGSEGQGGKGFPQDKITQFIYNTNKEKGQQVIILKNSLAIEKYNQLISEGKRPTLIYHNE